LTASLGKEVHRQLSVETIDTAIAQEKLVGIVERMEETPAAYFESTAAV
jgi:hypothetical protein